MDLLEIQTLYQKKQEDLLSLFSDCTDAQSMYEKIIQLGRSLPPTIESIEQECHLVHGCQSIVYLAAKAEEGNMYYKVHSDALISSGLAQLLLLVYQAEKIELTLFCPPLFIQKLGLSTALSISRSNGFASMYAKMLESAKKNFLLMHTPVATV